MKEAEEKLKAVCITHTAFKDGYPVAPLHWHIADKDQSLALECTKDGMHLYENPVGVLTNNPPFPFQLTNLQNYMHLTSNPPENRFAPALKLPLTGRAWALWGFPAMPRPLRVSCARRSANGIRNCRAAKKHRSRSFSIFSTTSPWSRALCARRKISLTEPPILLVSTQAAGFTIIRPITTIRFRRFPCTKRI